MSKAHVSASDFVDIHAQVRRFVPGQVVPRKNEIMADDRVPDDIMLPPPR